MHQKEWFENWFDSPFYPLLYDNRDIEEARLFVDKLMHFLQPPASSRLLDIACGEGRFAAQLSGYGHEVLGIDLSEPRIKVAKDLEHEHLHFHVHDMRYPIYINYFDYAFNFFTSFGYFNNQRDHRMAADSFAKALRKGGILVMDYFNKTMVEENLIPTEVITRGGITFHIKRHLDSGKVIKEISLTDKDGIDHHYQERVTAFGLEDFRSLFEQAGFTLQQYFGDYQLQDFDSHSSPRLIMVFKKTA